MVYIIDTYNNYNTTNDTTNDTNDNSIKLSSTKSVNKSKETFQFDKPNNIQTFDKPNPWTKIVFDNKAEFPYLFFLKISIPSLNDLQAWQQLIPNIDFDPMTRELIIPSKDEASVLAVANLIVSNFSGELSLDNILENNLIQISIDKSKKFDVVRNKLRDQITNQLYGSKMIKSSNNFEKDLALNNDNEKPKSKEKFTDNQNSTSLESFDSYEGGSDFSYL